MNSMNQIWGVAPHTLRVFGFVGCFVFGLLGTWTHYTSALVFFDLSESAASTTANTLWASSALLGLLAAIAPARLRFIYVAMSLLTMPIGAAVSFAVLLTLFYVVLTPTGWILRMLGRDPLRAQSRNKNSNWVECDASHDVDRYFRQF